MTEINQYRQELKRQNYLYTMPEFYKRGVKAVKMDEIHRDFMYLRELCTEILVTKKNCCLLV